MNDELKFYIGILKRRYPYFIAAFLVVMAAATVAAVIIPPIYRSEAKVLVESQQIPTDLVRSTVTGMADERIQVTRQRITARDALLTIAEKYDLFPEQRKKMTPSELVDLIRERILILPLDLSLAGRRAREGSLTVAFTVGFEYEKPDIAAKVANELVTLILNEDIRSRTSKASETTQFLERENARLQKELAKTDVVLSDFKQANKDALPERIPFQLSALERTETNLKNIDREIASLNESKRMLALEMSVRSAAGNAAQSKDGVILDPAQQLDALRAELTQKSAIYADDHPEIKALKNQIAAVEKQAEIVASTPKPEATLSQADKAKMDLSTRIVAEKMDTVDRQIALYNEQRTTLADAVSALNTVLSKAPEVQNRLVAMERQRDITQKSLDDISGKLSAARLGEQLEKDQQAERFEVIEQPITPQVPVRPDRQKILAIGAGIASMAGAASVAGLEILNHSIRSSSDIFKSLNRHPMVVIPYIRTRAETRKRVSKLLLFTVAILGALVAALAAIHFLFMPLDLLFIKIAGRLGI